MGTRDLIALIHLVGFTVGVALYGMLAVMTARAASSRPTWSPTAGRIPVLAAMLGLAWNAGALIDVAWQLFGLGPTSPWLLTVSYAALGFLPAVVVDSATRSPTTQRIPRIALAAYLLSAAAAAMLALAALAQRGTSTIGLLTLTLGYLAVILTLALGARRRDASRTVTSAALAAFALSALHLSRHSPTQDSWIVELVGHHASLPLVLVILYQDYRFALADLFLKRALSVLALVGVAVVAYVIVVPLTAGAAGGAPWLLLSGWIGTALVYPFVDRAVRRLVDRAMLRRPDYRATGAAAAQELRLAHSVEGALDTACTRLRVALTATRVEWQTADDRPGMTPVVTLIRTDEADVSIPTADVPGYRVRLGGLASGRRLLSDDIALIETIAMLLARRIDELRMIAERRERDVREAEMRRLTIEAELRALRAQLNPHFLFNALTTIDFLIRTAPARAAETLHQLTALLRSVLRREAADFVTLADELNVVDAYLAIERARFEERLTIERVIDPNVRMVPIPPLLLQPLVENAIKHGIAPTRAGGTVRIEARVEAGTDPRLVLRVSDTGPGFSWQSAGPTSGRLGVGLGNVSDRLRRYYGAAGEVVIGRDEGRTVVELRFPVRSAATARSA